jgi:hypothetical protein
MTRADGYTISRRLASVEMAMQRARPRATASLEAVPAMSCGSLANCDLT